MLLALNIHPSRRQDLLTPQVLSFSPQVEAWDYTDGFGNVGSAAHKLAAEVLGLKAGDVLRNMVGTELATQADFMAVFRRFQSGSSVPLTVERNGARVEFTLPVPHQKPFGS